MKVLAFFGTSKFSIFQEMLSDLILHCVSVGIKKISIYDPWSFVASNKDLLARKATVKVSKVNPKLVSFIHFVTKMDILQSDVSGLAVILLGKDSGRETLVSVCRKVCSFIFSLFVLKFFYNFKF